MIVELEELKQTPENQLNIDFNEYIPDLNNSVDVRGNITVKLTPYGVKIEGNVSTELELNCDRCLKSFIKEINLKVNEDFLFGTLVPEGAKDYELTGNEFVHELAGKDHIDLTDLLYQSITLDLPYQTLCTEDCPGSDNYQVLKEEDEVEMDPRLEKFKFIKGLESSNN